LEAYKWEKYRIMGYYIAQITNMLFFNLANEIEKLEVVRM